MENTRVVVDTSIFIDYLRAKDKRNTALFKIPDTHTMYISSITLFELYMGATNKEKWEDVKMLTEDLVVLPFDDTVSIKASEIFHNLRKINKLIEFRDIFIAATCLVHGLSVKTLNKAHFSRIKGLKVE